MLTNFMYCISVNLQVIVEWAAEEEGVEESEGEGGAGEGMVPSHARVEEDKKMMENEYDFQEANDNVSTIMHFIF